MLKRLFLKDDTVKRKSPEQMLEEIRAQDQGGFEGVDEVDLVPADIGYSPIEGVESIEDFYMRVGLVDEAIYSVKPFIDALSSMPGSEIKKALAKTLVAAKMDLDALNVSADACTNALTAASDAIQEQTLANVAEFKSNIEALKAEIVQQEESIARAEEICTEQKKLYVEEIKMVEWIATHIREGV